MIKDKDGKVLGYTHKEILEMYKEQDKWEKEHPVLNFIKKCLWIYPVHRIPYMIKEFRYKMLYFFQRMRRGFSDEDFFAAGDYIAKMTADMLEYFAENVNGFPTNMTYEDYIAKIRRIAAAHREYLNLDYKYTLEYSKVLDALVNDEIDYDQYDEMVKPIHEKEETRKKELYKIMAELYEDGFIERLWN